MCFPEASWANERIIPQEDPKWAGETLQHQGGRGKGDLFYTYNTSDMTYCYKRGKYMITLGFPLKSGSMEHAGTFFYHGVVYHYSCYSMF